MQIVEPEESQPKNMKFVLIEIAVLPKGNSKQNPCPRLSLARIWQINNYALIDNNYIK